MTKQEMMDTMVRSFGMENEHVINFFQWYEDNLNADYIDLIDAYNVNTANAVREILNNSERIW